LNLVGNGNFILFLSILFVVYPQLGTPCGGLAARGAPWLGLAAQQAVSISWKVLSMLMIAV
jgi:hypothetical protein